MIHCSAARIGLRACMARARMRRHVRSVEQWNMLRHRLASTVNWASVMFQYSFQKMEQWNMRGGLVAKFSNMLSPSPMVVAADPRRAVAPNKIGGVYAPSRAGRVLVAGRSGGGGKNFRRSVGQAVPIWVDEASALPVEALAKSGGNPPFFVGGSCVVAWMPSHGCMQDADIAAFSVDHLLITNLHDACGSRRPGRGDGLAAIGRPGGATPHPPVFVLGHPRRAGWIQPSGDVSDRRGRSTASPLKAGHGQVAEHNRDRLGSGVRGTARARVTGRENAGGLRCGVGQGAIAIVLAQGGSGARLGGGFGHVNRP